MPKIRGVKPDYWTDEDIVELSIPARLLFIGLWNYACDNGHFPDKPKQIKMRIFPGDDVDVAELLRELEASERITRANGWATIPKFAHHQKPNKRFWLTCEMPGCCKPTKDSQPEPPVDQGEPSLHNGEQPLPPYDGDVDCEVDGDGDGDIPSPAPAKKPRKKPATTLPADWEPTADHAARCSSDGIDLPAQVAKFRAHADANDRRQANWNAAFTQWLLNVPEWQKGQRPTPIRHLPHASELESPPDGLTPEEYRDWQRKQQARRGA